MNTSENRLQSQRRGSNVIKPTQTKVNLAFELGIYQVVCKRQPDGTQTVVEWVRGAKKIDTQVKSFSKGVARFKEKFAMKTTLETDPVTQQFIEKPTLLEVHVILDG